MLRPRIIVTIAGVATRASSTTPTRGAHESSSTYAATATDGLVTTAEHGEPFVAAVERGPLWATQFHPEKSGDAGAALLRNWLRTLDRSAR